MIRLYDLGIVLGGPVMGGVLEEIIEFLTGWSIVIKYVKSRDCHKHAIDCIVDTVHQKKFKLSSISPLSTCPDISTISLKLPLPLLPIPVISPPS